MKKKYLKLTQDQIDRGVIFSSTLRLKDTELNSGITEKTHEVLATDEDRELVIRRLLDDSFFNNSPFKYNEIRK